MEVVPTGDGGATCDTGTGTPSSTLQSVYGQNTLFYPQLSPGPQGRRRGTVSVLPLLEMLQVPDDRLDTLLVTPVRDLLAPWQVQLPPRLPVLLCRLHEPVR